ncbi:MAG: type II secretion system protein [Oscillospiraceae bacterium]|nr:type II secretion system protein [Oscillospiraceae bacterium]
MKRKYGRKTKRIKVLRAVGFTMAEMLIVIAILGILAGVAFVAVQQHQKSVTQLQYDTIAKEIFVAAQNHLTLAKSENYQDTDALTHDRGTPGDAVADQNTSEGGSVTYNNDIYYFYSGDTRADSILDQILPFGSVELVTGGSYIIRYQPKAAKVLDVFYWTDGSERYDANLGKDDYVTLVDSYREDAHKNHPDGLLGWCGGEGVVDSGDYLEAPVINVINDALLLVEVTDTNKSNTELSPQLKLIVSGEKSGAKVAIPLSPTIRNNRVLKYDNVDGKYSVALDDITTSGLHFADINNDTSLDFLKDDSGSQIKFIPGENIIIQAVAYSNTVLTSVAYSGEWTTNSLFGEVPVDKTTIGTTITVTVKKNVYISNIRHLENLNDGLSSVAYGDSFFVTNGNSNTINAVQTVDLDWNTFKTRANELKGVTGDAITTTAINIYDSGNKYTISNSFLPVSVSYTLTYNGQSETTNTTGTGEEAVTTTIKENHSIKNILVDNTGAASENVPITNAGIFGSLTGATINNLALLDTQVTLTTSGDAGTLAGSLIGSTVENVIAYNSTNATTANVTASSGSVGGLVGSISAKTELKKCAAAVIVSSASGNAGGLVGTATSIPGTLCKVSGCYSAGHTVDKTLTGSNTVVDYDSDSYNVIASGNAGGLIGDATATEIKYSYSTCSATGATVGGLVGKATGSIQYSYCTGLVKSIAATPVEGAFAGTYSGTAKDCMFFEIINEREETYGAAKTPTGGYTYLPPVNGTETVTGIVAMDETASTFNAFSKPRTVGYAWQTALPYNDTLTKYCGEGSGTSREAKYILKTVAQLALLDSLNTDFAVQGEPAESDNPQIPADFVATHYGDWPAPEIFVVNTQTN